MQIIMNYPNLPLKARIRQLAFQFGFSAMGVSDIAEVPRLPEFDQWLDRKLYGDMTWLLRHRQLRRDPRHLFADVKSVISFALPYAKLASSSSYSIAAYARYYSYHEAIFSALTEILTQLKGEFPEIHGRVIVDSAPLDERAWAAKSGLGFIGKNNLLITERNGSYVLLGELLINQELESDSQQNPMQVNCANCDACIRACPTGALQAYELNAALCISHRTIERKQKRLEGDEPQVYGWVFGCDQCLLACPYNHMAHHTSLEIHPLFQNIQDEGSSFADYFNDVSEVDFHQKFEHSELLRSGYRKILENIQIVKRQSIGQQADSSGFFLAKGEKSGFWASLN